MPTSRTARLCVLYGLMLVLLLGVHRVFTATDFGRRVTSSAWGLNIQYYSKLVAELSSLAHRSLEGEALATLEGYSAAAPVLSPRSGIHPRGLRAEADAPDGAIVRYSTDGSVPTAQHPRLTGPLAIDRTTVLRVKAFRDGRLPSRTVTASYIVEPDLQVPVVSLVLDPVYLFDKHSGIYARPSGRGRGWERPVDVDVIAGDGRLLAAEARLRIHGNVSRFARIKSFRLYLGPEKGDLRSWFGADAGRIADSQSEWVLKRVPNPRQLYTDRLIGRVAHQLGLAVSPSLPCLLYLNGELLGAYDLMERINPAFAEGKAEGAPFLVEHGSPLFHPVDRGDHSREWRRFYDWVVESDLSGPEAFAKLEAQIDVDNLIDYYALSIFMADGDRPHANIDLFRSEAAGRWWFGVWDFDGGLNYNGSYTDHDTLAWHLRAAPKPALKIYGVPDDPRLASSTTLLRALMANDGFRSRFVRRFEELLGTVFSTEALTREFDAVLADYEAFEQIERERFVPGAMWGEQISYEDRLREIREFIERRPGVMRELLDSHLAVVARTSAAGDGLGGSDR